MKSILSICAPLFVLVLASPLTHCLMANGDCAVADVNCNPAAGVLLYVHRDDSTAELVLLGAANVSGSVVLLESYDGLNWQTRGTFPNTLIVQKLYRHGDRLIGVGASAGNACYIATSEDFGHTWTERSCGGTATMVGIAAGKGMVVAVGQFPASPSTVRVSTDGGLTWTDPGSGPANAIFGDLAFFADKFMTPATGTPNGVYESSDPSGVAFTANTPVAGDYGGAALFDNKFFTANSTTLTLHGYDGSGWQASTGLFASRPVDESPSLVTQFNGSTIVIGGGATAGTSSCYVDSSADTVNFTGGGIIDSGCSAVAGDFYIPFEVNVFKGLIIASYFDIVGQSNPMLATSSTGQPGEWNTQIGPTVPLIYDTLEVFR